MDFTACPVCASPRIHAPNLSDGMIPGGGELIYHVCPDCGFRGSPLRFDSPDAYMEYTRRLQAGASASAEQTPAAAASAGEAAGAEAEAEEARSILEVQAPRRARATALFIGGIGIAAAAGGALLGALGVLAWRPLDAIMGTLTLGVGVAFLRVAQRLWSGAPAAVPA